MEDEEAPGSIRSVRSISDSSHRQQTSRKVGELRRTQSAIPSGSTIPRRSDRELDVSNGSNRSRSDSSRAPPASPTGRPLRRVQSAVQNGSTPSPRVKKSSDTSFSAAMSNIEMPETPSGSRSKFRGKRPGGAQSSVAAALSPVKESDTPLSRTKHLPRVNSAVGKSPASTRRPAAPGVSAKKPAGLAETSGGTDKAKLLKKRVDNEEPPKKKKTKDTQSDGSSLKKKSSDVSSRAKKLGKGNSSARKQRSPQSRVDMAGVTSSG